MRTSSHSQSEEVNEPPADLNIGFGEKKTKSKKIVLKRRRKKEKQKKGNKERKRSPLEMDKIEISKV